MKNDENPNLLTNIAMIGGVSAAAAILQVALMGMDAATLPTAVATTALGAMVVTAEAGRTRPEAIPQDK